MRRAQALVQAMIVGGLLLGGAAVLGLAWRVFSLMAGIG